MLINSFEKVKENIESLGHKLLSTEYKGTHSKLRVQGQCGHIWEATYCALYNNKTKCPHCAPYNRLEFKEVQSRIENLGIFLDSTEYLSNNSKLNVRCKYNHSWSSTCSNLLKTNGSCPECKREYMYKKAQDYLQTKGISILDTKYISSKHKMHVKCSLGHEWYATYSKLINDKSGCPYCAGNAKHTFLEVKAAINNLEIEVLSTEYINNMSKLHLRCKNGHEWHSDYNTVINRKSGCPVCFFNSIRLDFNIVKSNIESKDIELISTEYINCDTPLSVKCHNGHEWQDTYSNIMHRECGCPKCAGKVPYTIEELLSKIEARQFQWIDGELINSQSRILLRCKEGHEWWGMCTNIINNKSGCPYCAGQGKPDMLTVKQNVELGGVELLSTEYINANTKLHVRCKHGHEWYATYQNLYKGKRGCPICKLFNNSGERCSLWKGGTTLLDEYLRDATEDWRISTIIKYNYTCQITGKIGGKLEVHHASENFADIKAHILLDLNIDYNKQIKDYTEEDKLRIKEALQIYHNNVIGVLLCKPAHDLFHKLYSKYNNTYDQYLEFKQRYNDGEFSDLGI